MHTTIHSAQNSPIAPNAAAIALQKVTAVHGQTVALDGVSLQIARGETTVIAGRNGSGKSTLLEVLAGTHAVHGGRVLRAPGLSTALVVQRSGLPERLPLTVLDAVRMGTWAGRGLWRRTSGADREAVRWAIGSLALDGLEHRPVNALSGGQLQRVLIAQGIVQRADLLLLDEPMSGVDAHTAQRIEHVLDGEVQRGVTVVQVSHDAAVIAAAPRLVLLEGGRIVSQRGRADGAVA